MNYMVDHKAPNLPPGFLSEQLLSLAWILDAEGGRIFEIGREWLTSGDAFRAAVALGLNEALMADSWEELVQLAASLKERLPSLSPAVDEWLTSSRRAYETREGGLA